MEELHSRKRVVISAVKPEIDAGRFPIKRVVGEQVRVEADIIADGHDVLAAVVKYRVDSDAGWSEVPMQPGHNDRWAGSFVVAQMGRYLYTITAWIDRFGSWRRDLLKRIDASEVDLASSLSVGAALLAETGKLASAAERETLLEISGRIKAEGLSQPEKVELALDEDVLHLMEKYPDRRLAVDYPRDLVVMVGRQKAHCGAWYEMFPRSAASGPGRHGTLKDCEARLPYIAAMGFDTLYLPPIHPIGRTNRKGKNNSLVAGTDDPGTPWAIGDMEGGHKSIHQMLGSIDDFHMLVAKAGEYGIEIALDLALQCSPDHPYVREHPSWFVRRPDGSIQYAENPPKKYQDIYPLDFETEDWRSMWDELRSVVSFWIGHGIRIFRVDNPHTKSIYFWEWLIGSIKKEHPDVVFLAEAFTRPKVMQQLAKMGFDQSYTYFTWRNTKWELTQYVTELYQTELCDFFHPNLWPNTPDILTDYLQIGGRPAFMARLVLAATLGSSYGIYGPPFELCETRSREPGSEEYQDSEKYEIKYWDLDHTGSLKDFIARVNRIRRENPALQSNANLKFHPVDNSQIICYSKHTDDLSNAVLAVVNLDPHHVHSGWIELPLDYLNLDPLQPFQAHDLLTGARYLWQGQRNYVELNPAVSPAHVFRLRRRLRSERDFDYYM